MATDMIFEPGSLVDNSSSVKETDLLAALHAGQEAAFEVLFRRYYARVHRVLSRLVGDQADDLTQEVFMRLHRRPPRTLRGASLGPWLYRVALNLGYNALKAGRRRGRYRDVLGQLTQGVGWRQADPTPEAAAERSDDCRLVSTVLAGLDQRAATILTLRYSGFSYREIADAVGVAPGSVGTLLARAERSFEEAYRAMIGGEA